VEWLISNLANNINLKKYNKNYLEEVFIMKKSTLYKNIKSKNERTGIGYLPF
jgi:hypothetical protein